MKEIQVCSIEEPINLIKLIMFFSSLHQRYDIIICVYWFELIYQVSDVAHGPFVCVCFNLHRSEWYLLKMLKQKCKHLNKTKNKLIKKTHDRSDTRTWRVWRCRPFPGLWSATPLFGRCLYVNRTQRGGRGERVPHPPPDPPCSCNKSSSDWL